MRLYPQMLPNDQKKPIRCNEQIRVPQVLLIRDGQRVGVMPTFEALRLARESELDLVEIAPLEKPPVVSIMDYGKYKFDLSKKARDQRQNNPKEKEIFLRYTIDPHDLTTKINQIRQYLQKGTKVRLAVKFKGRENAHKDEGMHLITDCLQQLADIAVVEKQPSVDGAQIWCRLTGR